MTEKRNNSALKYLDTPKVV